MNIFLTGATGNIGSHTLDALLADGHPVRALVYEGELAKRHRGKVEVVRSDIRALTAEHVGSPDVVIHLAFIIPPACLERPDEARAINVGGTERLISLMQGSKAKLLFASTLDVYGHTAHLPPPRRITDPVQVTDVYSEHKITCEQRVQASGLTWGILRYADVPPLELRSPIPIMFELPLQQRIECIHPHDAGFATAKAAAHAETWGRIWHIGGGKRCQLTYGQYLAKLFAAMELGGELPESAFTKNPWPTDWLDTDESQRVFQFQRHGFEDIVRDIAALLGWRRPFARLARPLVRRHMLKLSKYYRA